MNKIFSFLKESNRYKHLIGGFFVGLLALTPWTAIYAAAAAALYCRVQPTINKVKLSTYEKN